MNGCIDLILFLIHKMSYKHRRDDKSSSSASHYDKAKMTIRQAFNKSPNDSDDIKNNYNFRLYETGRQERINEIADDDDGDLVVERQPQIINSDKTSRIIEANDRRHDAIIFGDKTIEGKIISLSMQFDVVVFYIEQQKNQLWDSFKQSSKYSTTSLAGPLLLEDPETKRLRWKNKIRDLWIQRYGAINMDTD
jgi:hypothetical protein